MAGGERGVGDPDRDRAGRLQGQVPAADVADVVFAVSVPTGGDGLDAGVGAVGVDRQQQTLGEDLGADAAAGGGGHGAQAAGTQHRFLQHVHQRHRAPAAQHLGLDPTQVPRLGLSRGGGQLDRPGAPLGDREPLQCGQGVVEGGEFGAHLLPRLGDEVGRVQRFAQLTVVIGAVLLEIGRQVLIGVPPPVRAGNPDLLAAQGFPQRLKGGDLVGHPHHPAPAAGIDPVHHVFPITVDAAVRRHRLPPRVINRVAGRRVTSDQRQSLDHRPVGGRGHQPRCHAAGRSDHQGAASSWISANFL